MANLKAPIPGPSGWSSQLLVESIGLGVSYPFLQMEPTEDAVKSWPENSSGARGQGPCTGKEASSSPLPSSTLLESWSP